MKIHVWHILVKHEYEAQDLLRLLKAGKSFEELARKYSTCPSASAGGDLGVQDLSRFEESFGEAALILKPGQISASVRTRFGYHLIQRIS